MSQVHSYNDADGYLSNPSAFSESYMRGANIWKDGAHTIPRDCQRFFLAPGVAENWSTLRNNLIRLPDGVKVGFRITDFNNVPAGWRSRTIRGNKYPDFNDAETRTKYRDMLIDFKAEVEFGQPGGVTWIDNPYPYAPSNEPSITEADARELGGGDLAKGKEMYFEAAKWIIDLYVEVFKRAVVGNLGGGTWVAEELLPYMKAKGIRAFRQDSWMRFNWGGFGVDGQNRASMYDQRIAMLGGRDEFDRLIPEQTGNGLTLRNGVIVDQGSGAECTVYDAMMGIDGEFSALEATDYGNMGLPSPAEVAVHPNAQSRYDAWYEYIGQPSQPGDPDPPPGDGGDPVPAPFQFPVEIRGGEIVIAHFGGDFPDIVFDPGTTEAVIPIPIVDGDRWNPRVHVRPWAEDDMWSIDPAEPSHNDRIDSFHCWGRDSAVVTFEGWEEPEPDPDPTDPVEPEFVTKEEFDAHKAQQAATFEAIGAHVGSLLARIEEVEENMIQAARELRLVADALEGKP